MKTIAITMGEAGGIGPEVTVRALMSPDIRGYCDAVVVGDARILAEAAELCRAPLKIKTITDAAGLGEEKGVIKVLHMPMRLPARKGIPSKSAGKAVVRYIEKAVELAVNGQADAIVTAPLSKESLSMAGYRWHGHTELLAELTRTRDVSMMFVSDRLNVILTTIHIPLKDVPGRITKAKVLNTVRHAKRGARMLGNEKPRVAVAGLNPHAGESGLIGDEELTAIAPAVSDAGKEGIEVSGPYPPDVVFFRALQGDFDIVVCMYHDQGLIPFKMLSFDAGVNVTVGLPVIRTSPDHGTAFDIAWKGRANPSSMIASIKLAMRLESGV